MPSTATWVGLFPALFIVRYNILTEKYPEYICRLLYYHGVDTCVTTPSRKQSTAGPAIRPRPQRQPLVPRSCFAV